MGCVSRLQSVPERINPAVLAQLPLEMQQELAESMARAVPAAGRLAGGTVAAEAIAEDNSVASAYVHDADCRDVWERVEGAFAELASTPQTTIWRKQQAPGGRRVSETESVGQTKARALAAVLVEWAQTVAQHNLESLQWLLRQLQHASGRWPDLGPVMLDAAADIQSQIQQQLGAPLHVFSLCTAACV